MRVVEGVEWALHCCLNLIWVGPGVPVSAGRLAEFYDLPAAYLTKQMQALARAGLVSSTPGPRGGFELSRTPDDITLMDVVTAIEGPEPAFRCTEIRRQGPAAAASASSTPCAVSVAMSRADLAWRRELAAQSLAEISATVQRTAPEVPERARRWFTGS